MKNSNIFKHIVICVIFIILTLFFTHPFYFHATDSTWAVGDAQDMIWHAVWTYDHILKDPGNLLHGNMFYPAKYTYIFTDHMIGTFLIFAPVYFLTHNPVLAHNAILFVLTVLGAMSMYSLVYYWTRRRLPAFFAGFILAFSPVLLFYHMNLAIIVAPMAILFLDKFLKNERIRDIIIFSLIFSFIALSHIYLGYSIAFITVIYIAGYYFKIKRKFNKNFYTKSLLGFIIVLILVLPFRLPYLQLKKEYGYQRKLGEMVQHSADPIISYFSIKSNLYNITYPDLMIEKILPGEEWLFQKAVSVLKNRIPMGIEKLPGETYEEKIPYSRFLNIMKSGREGRFFFGFVPLILALLGIFYMKKYENGKLEKERKLLLYIMFTFYILSLGPVLVILGHITYIPLPDLLFYYIIPGFSSMRRVVDFGFVAVIILIFFAGFGIMKVENWIENKYKKSKNVKLILFSLIFLISTAEIIRIPAPEHRICKQKVNDTIPEVYKWLGKQTINGAVAELPTVKGKYNKYDPVYGPNRAVYAEREIYYVYYSNFHKKNIINGWGAVIPDSFYEIRDNLYSLPDSSSVDYLKSLNINTFILHTADFDPEDKVVWTEENINKMGLEEIVRFQSDIVYQFKD